MVIATAICSRRKFNQVGTPKLRGGKLVSTNVLPFK